MTERKYTTYSLWKKYKEIGWVKAVTIKNGGYPADNPLEVLKEHMERHSGDADYAYWRRGKTWMILPDDRVPAIRNKKKLRVDFKKKIYEDGTVGLSVLVLKQTSTTGDARNYDFTKEGNSFFLYKGFRLVSVQFPEISGNSNILYVRGHDRSKDTGWSNETIFASHRKADAYIRKANAAIKAYNKKHS